MKTFSVWIIMASAVLLAASCSYDDSNWQTPQTKTNTVRFSLSVPGTVTPPATTRGLTDANTRSLTDIEERAVDNVDVLVFYTDGALSGKLYSREKAKSMGYHTFEIELPEGTFDLVMIGNATTEVDNCSALVTNVVDKQTAVAALVVENSAHWNKQTLPMWGYKDAVVIDQDTSLTGSDAVDMHRMVSKVDVKLSALAAGTGNSNFELKSVRLYNFNTKGRIAPDAANWNPTGGVINAGKGIATAPTIPSDHGAVRGVNNPLEFNTSHGLTANQLLNTIYTFEATNGTASTKLLNPCLVVGGIYNNSGKETFYRVDFIKKENNVDVYLKLLRNHQYLFMVNSVTGDGYDTPQEAFDAISLNIQVDVMEWEDGEITGFQFDGQNYLGVSQDVFEFTAEARDGASTDNKLKIRTDVTTGWTAEVWADVAATVPVPADGTTGNPWLRISINAGSGMTVADVMSLNMDANGSGGDRTAYVHLKAGRLTYVVEVTQRYHTLRIVDVLTGKEISMLSFGSKRSLLGVNPTPRQIRVEWSPASETVTIQKTAGSPDLTWSADHTTPLTGGVATLTINPPGITQVELNAIPYISKNAQLKFVLGSSGVMTTLAVDHSYYELTAQDFVTQIVEGEFNGQGTIQSNAPWKAICHNNLFTGGMTHPVYAVTGGPTTGYSYPYSFAHANGEVTFSFVPTHDKMDFDPVNITVNVDQLPLPQEVDGIGDYINTYRSYVGAFWRTSQRGERLIRIPVTAQTKGKWAAQVLDHGGFDAGDIQFSTAFTADNNVTYLTSNEVHTDPDVGGWYVNDKVYAMGNAVAAGDYIYFRLGLKQTITTGAHRYARVVISYANFQRNQVLFLRQGEEPDFLMHADDMLNATQLAALRKFTVYNITAPGMSNSDYTNVAIRGGVFVNYPSKAGANFQFAPATGYERRAYHPSKATTAALPTGMTNWDPSKHEVCPSSYRRFAVPDLNNASTSEATMSLVADKRQRLNLDGYNHDNTSGWGYYADGYFDRLAIVNSYDLVHGAEHSVVKNGSYEAAYAGRVIFNNKPDSPTRNASLFIPGTGTRNGDGSIHVQGATAYLWSSSNAAGSTAIDFRQGRGSIGFHNDERTYPFSIRCVVE